MTKIKLDESKYAQKAMTLFKEGYNCSQSVFLAFEDQYEINRREALMLSSSFGGGMGRLREVCGAVTGMFMVAGLLYGYDNPNDIEAKACHYERIQELAEIFENNNNSIICRTLLGLDTKKDGPMPEKRTEAYYTRRPCVRLIGTAAAIMEDYIKKHPL